MKQFRLICHALLLGVVLFSLPIAATAQSQYSAKIKVNERTITAWELDQRALMIAAFGGSGDVAGQAREQLIDERLYQDAAADLNLNVGEDEIQGGMAEFAARGNLSVPQILQYLASRGVAEQSFRDFVTNGLLWRTVVRTRFAEEARVSDEEIDRTLVAGGNQDELLLSEIIIPNVERGEVQTEALLEQISNTARTAAAFSQAARRYSRAASARRGGRLDWIPASNLPPAILSQILILQENEVTGPIDLNGAQAIFQLRGTRRTTANAEEDVTLRYAIARAAGENGSDTQRANARVMINKSDTCLDLRAYAGEANYKEFSSARGDISEDIGMALAKLDDGEATTYVSGDGSNAIVMLCNLTRALPEGARDELRAGLFNRKISNLGSGYLQELKAEAYIVEK